jgi:hypothetical protein
MRFAVSEICVAVIMFVVLSVKWKELKEKDRCEVAFIF